MIEAVAIQPGIDTGEPSVAGVSWPAVAAGAVVSCALTVVLIAFGLGLGLSVVSPWAGAGVSATTFKIGTGLYLIVIAMLSSSIGGYIAGRLRTRWIGVHSDEVYFRDTAHGFVAWAFASVLGAVLLASPVSSLISGGARPQFRARLQPVVRADRWMVTSIRFYGLTHRHPNKAIQMGPAVSSTGCSSQVSRMVAI